MSFVECLQVPSSFDPDLVRGVSQTRTVNRSPDFARPITDKRREPESRLFAKFKPPLQLIDQSSCRSS
jgi:hypothetical protein